MCGDDETEDHEDDGWADLHFSYWEITSLMRYEICFLLTHRRFHVADENFALEKLQRFLKSQDVWNAFTILQKTVTFPVVILWAIPIVVLSWNSSITLLSLHKELGSTPKSQVCLVFARGAKEHTQVLQVFLVFTRGAKEHTKRLTSLSCLRTRS